MNGDIVKKIDFKILQYLFAMEIHIAYDPDNKEMYVGKNFEHLKKNIMSVLWINGWREVEKIKVILNNEDEEEKEIEFEYYDMCINYKYHCVVLKDDPIEPLDAIN